MICFIDIETLPSQDAEISAILADSIKVPGQYKKADSIAEWERTEKPRMVEEAVLKTSLDGAYGQVCMIGLAFDDEPATVIYERDWLASEKTVLERAFAAIEDRYMAASRSPLFVGHYVNEFDLRFLYQRAVIQRVKPPAVIPFNERPGSGRVFDTMTAWAGYRGTVSLKKLCGVLHIECKSNGIDGSKVWEYVQAGRIDEVAAYCAEDVESTRAAYKRLTFQG